MSPKSAEVTTTLVTFFVGLGVCLFVDSLFLEAAKLDGVPISAISYTLVFWSMSARRAKREFMERNK